MRALLAVSVLLPWLSSTSLALPIIAYIPLDERFATRGLFLNLANLLESRYEVKTPAEDVISSLHVPANLTAIDDWLEQILPNADSLIISIETYVYGGLITSRESNTSLAEVEERASKVANFKRRFPNLKVYVSSVVMRIPGYNGDFEEPWYWEYWGYDLFEFSFHTSRYQALGDRDDAAEAERYKAIVPSNVMTEFLWRRGRNHNVSTLLLDLLARALSQGHSRLPMS